MKRYVHVITVKGKGPFPLDMLRYDRCSPNTSSDASSIGQSFYTSAEYVIQVQTDRSKASWKPTNGRWESFGWNVIDITVRAIQE